MVAEHHSKAEAATRKCSLNPDDDTRIRTHHPCAEARSTMIERGSYLAPHALLLVALMMPSIEATIFPQRS
jgi:hypothetical protein